MNRAALVLLALVACSSAANERAHAEPPAVEHDVVAVAEPEPAAAPAPEPVAAEPEETAEPTTAEPVAEAPEIVGPPEPPFPARPGPHRVLILGDSMAATDFGRALEKQLDRRPDVTVARRGKSSTGLARPDYFDWMAESARRVKKHDPDLVVVIIGGNDGQDLQKLPKAKGPKRVFWKSDKWPAAYADRVTDFCMSMLTDYRRVVWLELPVMDHRRLEKKLELIRRVQREALAKLEPRVHYVATRDHFLSEKGRLLRKVKAPGYKRPQQLRQEDGIHFTVPGGRYFADRVAKDVLAALGVTEERQ